MRMCADFGSQLSSAVIEPLKIESQNLFSDNTITHLITITRYAI